MPSAYACIYTDTHARTRQGCALVALHNSTASTSSPRDWMTNWLSDRPIGEWHGVTTDSSGHVTKLDLKASTRALDDIEVYVPSSSDRLRGRIPPELRSLASLTWLDLRGHLLSGEIPSELGKLTNLRFLNISRNNMRGEIPSELGRLSNLTTLDLWGNELISEIPPELGNLLSLAWLRLSQNPVERVLTSEVTGREGQRLLRIALPFC